MRMEEYLTKVTEQIRCQKARELVVDELKDHILEQAEAYETEGMEESEALEQAVRQMGDPVETGVSLDRVHRPKMSWSMLGLTAVISLLSLAVHAALIGSGEASRMGLYYFRNDVTFTLLGYVLMLLVYRMDYSILSRYARWMAAGMLLFLVLGSHFLGVEVHGMVRYIRVGPFTMSISTLMYLYVPVFGGILYQYRGEGYRALGKIFLWAAAPVLMAFKMPSLNLAIILCWTFTGMFCIAVWKGWYQIHKKRDLVILGVGILALPALLWMLLSTGQWAPYQIDRVRAFLSGNPDYDYYGQVSREFLSGSRLLGQGTGNALQLSERLPGYNMDYILISLISLYGVLTGALALLLLAFLFMKIFKISVRQKNQLGLVTGCGCGILFLIQLVLCLGVTFSLCPSTSVTLPFFSYGGSTTVVSYMLLGLVLSIYRHKDILPERPAKKVMEIAP